MVLNTQWLKVQDTNQQIHFINNSPFQFVQNKNNERQEKSSLYMHNAWLNQILRGNDV